ncbi:MAG TPA: cytochrome b/b6 domain-containing protein [Devosiaceae bacterium]|nr:cytochrome b/b6 domain-containing protein [Devosiaceae bacterium]
MNDVFRAPAIKTLTKKGQQVMVWDIWVRMFHWSFAVLVATAWLTHLPSPVHGLHEWVGYGAAGLVVLRVVWGFIGSEHARFARFVPGPSKLLGYVSALARGRERRYLTHNPLGAMMVLLLLALSIEQATTGFVMTHHGMTLFGLDRRSLHHVHGFCGNLFLYAVPLHLVGVIVESLRHRENLVRSMIFGTKRAAD